MLDTNYFGPESITWKIGREAVLNLGGARAVLMQLAHPLVAAGVSAHSRYLQEPLARSMSTFLLGQKIAFGSLSTARDAARTINRLHVHVHGTLSSQAGVYPAGTIYDARDPELLLWVHATLVDTILLVYPLFVGPLSQEEQDQYYQESKTVANLLGLPSSAMPESASDLRNYVKTMVSSNRLTATAEAHQLARVVLFPPTSTILHPLLHLHYQLTCALLPQPVRELYGIEWGTKRQTIFELSARSIRIFVSHLPPKLRVLPITSQLMQQSQSA